MPQISGAVTYKARSVRSLLSTLLSNQKRHESKPILLFALAPSSTTPPEDLSDITSAIFHLYPEHVGCISAPLPYQHFDPRIRAGSMPCFLAYALLDGVSFRSTISGRAQAQVGRWHAARQRITDIDGATRLGTEASQMRIVDALSDTDGNVNWEDVWGRTSDSMTSSPLRHENGLYLEKLPDALRNLDPPAVKNIIYFSDKAPEGLATALQGAFPQANKVSLIASSTPFITGRPVTLFHNGSILSDGAVGVALESSFSSPSPAIEPSFPPLVPLSTDLKVTRSAGNLILSLDSGNPTQTLLSAIQNHGLPAGKEDEFYVGVIDPSSQRLFQLHRIDAGDPSRGALALDAASAPRECSTVRLYHSPRDSSPTHVRDTVRNSISLCVVSEMTARDETADDTAADMDCVVASNAFLAGSENGFTVARGTERPWKCVVPGGRVHVQA